MATANPDLVARARRGDRAALAELYELFAPMVYTLARRLLASSGAAEDALHDTFVEVIGKLAGFRGDGEIGYWIRRIAVNRCLMMLRSPWVSRRAPVESVETQVPESAARHSPDRTMDLEQALATLPPTTRAVVWLHDVEGYTHGEIGRMMGRTASFSKSQLARAHQRLRELLDEGGATGDAAALEQSTCATVLKTC